MFLYLYTQTEEETLMDKGIIHSQEWSCLLRRCMNIKPPECFFIGEEKHIQS